MARGRALTTSPVVAGAGAALGLLGVAWWVTGLPPFSWSAGTAVTATGVATIAFGLSRPKAHRSGAPVPAGGVVGWTLLLAAIAAWQLAAYAQHPRVDHPTLSSLANTALEPHPLRALAFLAWVVLGGRFIRR